MFVALGALVRVGRPPSVGSGQQLKTHERLAHLGCVLSRVTTRQLSCIATKLRPFMQPCSRPSGTTRAFPT
jgi:hypothetical protein